MLYKLWSGFTKNLRHLLLSRPEASIKLNRIGTFTRKLDADTGMLHFGFSPSHELISAFNSMSPQDLSSISKEIGSKVPTQLDW